MAHGPTPDSGTSPPASVGDVPVQALAASFDHCHRVTRRCAGNFYLTLKLTPEPRRSALYVIYAFMRACDDLVDGSQPPRDGRELAAAAARIEEFRAAMRRAVAPDQPLPDGPLWPALRHVTHRYRLAPSHFDAMLDGQRMDLFVDRYATFNDLYAYCYNVASVVGLACLNIWGHDGDPGVPKLAEYRGVGFQLTNILRDVVEDARRGRAYLPQEDLHRFGVTLDQLAHGHAGEGFERLMVYQIERARSYYQMSESLERHIDPACRATTRAMMQVYRRLLERIAADPLQMLARRVTLGRMEKLALVTRAALRRGR